MKRVTCSPMKYIQGKGELGRLYDYVSDLGRKGAHAIVDPYILDNYQERIEESFRDNKIPLHRHRFAGESSRAEVDRIVEATKATGNDVVIGIGGGKTLDTAKAVGHHLDLPIVIVPTAASSDAPCSALSVLYTDDGRFDCYLPLKNNPDLVLVDTSIVAHAPVRLLTAGMGDALATYYEARACQISRARTNAGGTCSLAGLSIAKACRDTLFADGYKAKIAVENRALSEAVENIIETNIYLSGIGFESGGLAAAHAIHNGLTVLEECHQMLHGEKVAFGTIVQLVLENAPEEELNTVLAFCRRIGLPTTLSMLGITDPLPEKIMKVAGESCAEDTSMHNMPFEITQEAVYSAIFVADHFGRWMKPLKVRQ